MLALLFWNCNTWVLNQRSAMLLLPRFVHDPMGEDFLRIAVIESWSGQSAVIRLSVCLYANAAACCVRLRIYRGVKKHCLCCFERSRNSRSRCNGHKHNKHTQKQTTDPTSNTTRSETAIRKKPAPSINRDKKYTYTHFE